MDGHREVRQGTPAMSTRCWCALLLAVFVAALAACFWPHPSRAGGTAVVRVNSEIALTIDLSAPDAEYAVGGNVLRVQDGRICVAEADCPDQICVRQGWIGGGDVPIACLPNRLVVSVEGGEAPQFDAVSQ